MEAGSRGPSLKPFLLILDSLDFISLYLWCSRMLPIFGTSVDISIKDDGLPKDVLPYKADSELRILEAKKGLLCKLQDRLVLLTQRSGEVENVLLFLLFLPPTINNSPKFFGKDVLITLVISFPNMIGGSLKIPVIEILSPVQALAFVQWA